MIPFEVLSTKTQICCKRILYDSPVETKFGRTNRDLALLSKIIV